MRDYRWFKILVRAIGILIVGESLFHLTTVVDYGLRAIQYPRGMGGPSSYWTPVAVYGIGFLVQFLFGCYLISGAPKFVRYCIEQVEDRCIRCDYDIRGLTGQCPECGLPIPTVVANPPAPSDD
jgi:hypothetical protein